MTADGAGTVLIFAPGGFLERQSVRYAVRGARKQGLKPVVVRYPLGDIPEAVRYSRRIAAQHPGATALGFSAGGILAQILAAEGRVSRAVAVGAPSSLEGFDVPLPTDWRQRIGATDRIMRRFSPVNRWRPDSSPLLVVSSRGDSFVPAEYVDPIEPKRHTRVIRRAWGEHGPVFFARAVPRAIRFLTADR